MYKSLEIGDSLLPLTMQEDALQAPEVFELPVLRTIFVCLTYYIENKMIIGLAFSIPKEVKHISIIYKPIFLSFLI